MQQWLKRCTIISRGKKSHGFRQSTRVCVPTAASASGFAHTVCMRWMMYKRGSWPPSIASSAVLGANHYAPREPFVFQIWGILCCGCTSYVLSTRGERIPTRRHTKSRRIKTWALARCPIHSRSGCLEPEESQQYEDEHRRKATECA
jgi:hypothetical protein